MMRRKTVLVLGAAVLAWTQAASARIKLAALPVRERVEVQLDNGNYTLVEEERIVPLLKSTAATGNNMIDFSWSNTTVEKDSIQFRPIAVREGDRFRAIRKVKAGDGGEVDEVGVINVAYPPNENALVWEVFAAEGCAVKVRVSYLLSNLNRWFSYEALAEKEEDRLTSATTWSCETGPARSSGRPESGRASDPGSSRCSASRRRSRCSCTASPRCPSRRPSPSTGTRTDN